MLGHCEDVAHDDARGCLSPTVLISRLFYAVGDWIVEDGWDFLVLVRCSNYDVAVTRPSPAVHYGSI
jgi:hypothetical protein